MSQLVRDCDRLDQSSKALLIGVKLLIVIGTDVTHKRTNMVPAYLKLFQIEPISHRFVDVLHGQLPRLQRILQTGLQRLIWEKRQKTVRVDQLDE